MSSGNTPRGFGRRALFAVEQFARSRQQRLLNIGIAGSLVLIGAIIASLSLIMLLPDGTPVTDKPETLASGPFQPPEESAIPDGPDGDAIRRGQEIFGNTRLHAARYVGSDLSCSSCHLEKGRKANSSPMWSAWVSYPKYRSKDNAISTMEDRIRGCFIYSMNAQYSPEGAPPAPGSDIYRDLQAYFYWLAKGIPTGEKIAGSGFPTPPVPAGGYDFTRGAVVYEQYCSACHGNDGNGQRNADGSVAIPPLWGDRSYNWGAGMARIDLAAGFIQANMPLGQENTLSDQQAWDVAAYVDGHERPRDPRQTGTVADNARRNYKGQHSFYGKVVNEEVLGVGTRRLTP